MLPCFGAFFWALVATPAYGQSTPITGLTIPQATHSASPVKVSKDSASHKAPVDTVARRRQPLLVLGRDSLRLFDSDSLARIDLWLGYQYESVGRRKDAESAYLRVLPKASYPAKSYAHARLRAILEEDEVSGLRWIPRPYRPAVVWLWHRPWRWEAFWVVALSLWLYWRRRAARAGKTQFRIQPFTKDLPPDIGVAIEKTIADFHARTTEVGAPVGILWNSGQKLPVMSTAPGEDLVELLEIVGPPSWIPKVLRFILRTSDKPRFVVTGYATGTLSAVRIAVGLADGGRRVRSWDRTVSVAQLADCERSLACEVIYALSEYSS